MRLSALLTTVVSLVVCSLAGRAFGQLESKTALAYDFASQKRNAAACFALKVQLTQVNSVAKYVTELQTKAFDLVILEITHPSFYITAVEKPVLIGLFEEHLAKGGALLVNYPDLDSWPQLAELCGAVVTKDRGQDQWALEQAIPVHPAWFTSPFFPNSTLWPDHGDEIAPLPGSTTLAIWNDTAQPASVLGASESTIINSFDWDQYSSGPSSAVSKHEVSFLLGCRADLNEDGLLTVDDFFEFQNLFSVKSPFANMCFDEFFDVFDFLEFFNFFIEGCD